jgi:hypothetical protein
MEESLFAEFEAARWINGLRCDGDSHANDLDENQLTELVRRVNNSLELDWLSFHVKAGRIWWKDRVANGTALDRVAVAGSEP